MWPTVSSRWVGAAGALVWLPLLLLDPALNLPEQHRLWGAIAIVVMAMSAVASVTVAMTRPASRVDWVGLIALLAACAATTFAFGEHWQTPWQLAAIVTAVVIGWPRVVGGVVAVTAMAVIATARAGEDSTTVWTLAEVTLLSGLVTAVFVRLIGTIDTLERTRRQVAELAVAAERDRVSRDLHDLLGHTLSVIVVKAQAVRRLVATDPAAAVEHARDIETIGRQSLGEVRQAVDDLRTSRLRTELHQARRALAAGGVQVSVAGESVALPPQVDEVFGWVVREGSANVLRHSVARHCRIQVSHEPVSLTLEMTDDGPTRPRLDDSEPASRAGGIDGLRARVTALGGQLDAGPSPLGFRLRATVPVTSDRLVG
ncbi:MAG: histidine kinase [Humibacillus sp.]|nr:histidine kinase [Humibacillus sp.]MDN5779387.1 histidine kinase [Humibacillus sp.]